MSRASSTVPSSVWQEVWHLADTWSDAPIVQQVAAGLPRHHLHSALSGGMPQVPSLISELASEYGGLFSSPLLIGSRVRLTAGKSSMVEGTVQDFDGPELDQWIEASEQLQEAHHLILAWIRSRLSGYPILLAPHLASGTPHTTWQLLPRFIWEKDELAMGLQYLEEPPSVAALLGANERIDRAVRTAVRKLALRLQEAPAWKQFEAVALAMNETGRNDLRQVRVDLKRRLSENVVDAHAKGSAVLEHEFRSKTMCDLIGTLSGRARQYADAFDDVDNLINHAVCNILGELLLYGDPLPIPVNNMSFPTPGQQIVKFSGNVGMSVVVQCGQLVRLESAVVPDVVQIQEVSSTIERSRVVGSEFVALVLQGTSAAWPRPV